MNVNLPEKLLEDLDGQFSGAMEPYSFKPSEIKEVERDYKAVAMKEKKGKKKGASAAGKKKKQQVKKKTKEEGGASQQEEKEG